MMSDADDPHEAELLGKIIANSKAIDGSVFIAAEDGIHWKSIQAAAGIIKYLEANTAHSQGNFNFTASAFIPSGTPFFPASYFAGEGKQFAIGLESANTVADVLASTKSPSEAEARLTSALGKYATQIEKTALEISASTGWAYGGIDLSPAPLKDVSIGQAIENFTGAPLGSSGTLSTAALITRSLKAIPVKQAGYSGLMLPVLEDTVIAKRWNEGRLSIDALLSYSAVCGTGLDTIPLPGDVTLRRARTHSRRRRQPFVEVAQTPLRPPAAGHWKEARRLHAVRQPLPHRRNDSAASLNNVLIALRLFGL